MLVSLSSLRRPRPAMVIAFLSLHHPHRVGGRCIDRRTRCPATLVALWAFGRGYRVLLVALTPCHRPCCALVIACPPSLSRRARHIDLVALPSVIFAVP